MVEPVDLEAGAGPWAVGELGSRVGAKDDRAAVQCIVHGEDRRGVAGVDGEAANLGLRHQAQALVAVENVNRHEPIIAATPPPAAVPKVLTEGTLGQGPMNW
jgi:hypothetical protein